MSFYEELKPNYVPEGVLRHTINILSQPISRMDKLQTPYEKRAKQAKNHAAGSLFELMARKKTNLCIAADLTIAENVLALADAIGPEIALFKTHVDIIEDFTPEFTEQLTKLSEKHNFMIFEDRKFADIGNTVRLQYSKGIYKIGEWADFVNVHIVPGSGVLKGIEQGMKETEFEFPRGIIILSQMSSEGNMTKGDYMATAVGLAHVHNKIVAGHIGDGSNAEELKRLTSVSEAGHIVFTPGIKIGSHGDALGQQYATPQSAIYAGSDCIVVGRGIYTSKSAEKEAEKYRQAAWGAYEQRVKGK